MCYEDQRLIVGRKHGVEILISLDMSLDDAGDTGSSRKIEQIAEAALECLVLRYLSGMKWYWGHPQTLVQSLAVPISPSGRSTEGLSDGLFSVT